MTLGQKLLQARQEAGLSQRQLCGEQITRNMLSQIEHDAAYPSMKTLQYLAARLGKSVGYFLEEGEAASPNQRCLESARQRYEAGDPAGALEALTAFQEPDSLLGRECVLLGQLCRLMLGEQALEQGRIMYARELLEKPVASPYCQEALERRRLLALGRLPGQRVAEQLPSLDGELLLRAEEALEKGDLLRASALLEAVQKQRATHWLCLRGRVYMAAGDYAAAIPCLMQAEERMSQTVIPLLEVCYRETGDYKMAYLYACKQRK